MMDWGSTTPLIESAGWLENDHVHVTAVSALDYGFGFAFGDGSVLFANANGDKHKFASHDGAALCAAPLGARLVTAGDDGRVVVTAIDGTQTVIYEQFGRFFDQLATSSWGGIAFADGRKVFAVIPDAANSQRTIERRYQASGSVCGLCFAPKGRKLAASRNNGASVYWVGTERDTPDDYEWLGAHGPITWSPSGEFVVTSMQENALHVWRTDHKKHGRMGGYPTRIKAMSWNPKGNALATSGSNNVVIWPFATKNGPIGQGAAQWPLNSNVALSQLSWHPKQDVILTGNYEGDVTLVHEDGAVLPVAQALGSVVTSVAFSKDGKSLAFGTDEGAYGVVACADL
ncbi:MAG: WD40 repeat domain-containing protein [Hyphomicrobiales bacterium]